MKTALQIRPLTKSTAARFLLHAMVICGSTVPAIAGAQADKPVTMDKMVVSEDTKTHTLFMGADVAVNLGKDLYPVRGVVGSSWVIERNGKEEVVATKEGPLSLKVTPSLKLTEVSVTVAGYKSERAYTFDNDPTVRFTRGLNQTASMNADLQAVASNAQHIADTMAMGGVAAVWAETDIQFGDAAMLATARALGSPKPISAAAADSAAIGRSKALAQQTTNAALNQTENGNEPGGRLVQTGLDAIDVEFEVSSARPLKKPYVVTMTRFHPNGSKPGTVQNLVYARELGPIDLHPTSVHFVEGGFPYDFELIDFQLHLYNRGEEVATTVSSKRVELTRDEAFEYVKIDYIGAHKGDTLPAVPAMGKLPGELKQLLAEGKYREAFYVKVSKDGLPAGEVFLDAACSKRVEDTYLESVVKRMRFKPALQSGKPIECVASLNLRQLEM
jgi:hypothetical protein